MSDLHLYRRRYGYIVLADTQIGLLWLRKQFCSDFIQITTINSEEFINNVQEVYELTVEVS